MREMKDSGVPWIGEIPKGWRKYRIKYNTFLKGRIGWQGLNSSDFIDEGYCLITGTDFDNKGGIHWDTCYRISKERFDEDELLHVKEGDLLMTKDGTVGKMALIKHLPEEASLNSHLLIIRQITSMMTNEFLYWMMMSGVFKHFCALYQSGSIMSSIGQGTLESFSCPCPPLGEQRRIAEFLDAKCTEIDFVLEQTKASIEEYKKLKQSVITEAVTKGIRGERPMKDSGVEWIGEIPTEWRASKLKYVANTQGRIGFKGYTSADLVGEGEGALTIGGKHIGRNLLDLTDPDFISWEKYYESPEIMVAKGDLLIAQRGSVGKVALVNREIGEATINPSLVLIRCHSMNEKLLYYNLIADFTQKEISLLNTATAVPMISQWQINNLHIITPPLPEQQEIVIYLDEKCAAIDSLIASKEALITELEAYKKSLIYEYVTGKKEVM